MLDIYFDFASFLVHRNIYANAEQDGTDLHDLTDRTQPAASKTTTDTAIQPVVIEVESEAASAATDGDLNFFRSVA